MDLGPWDIFSLARLHDVVNQCQQEMLERHCCRRPRASWFRRTPWQPPAVWAASLAPVYCFCSGVSPSISPCAQRSPAPQRMDGAFSASSTSLAPQQFLCHTVGCSQERSLQQGLDRVWGVAFASGAQGPVVAPYYLLFLYSRALFTSY